MKLSIHLIGALRETTNDETAPPHTSFCKKEYVTTSYKMGFSSYLEADRSDKKGPVKGLISKCPRMHAKSEENERKMSSVFTKHGSRAKRSIEKQRLQKGG
jgi:hypothetical protein